MLVISAGPSAWLNRALVPLQAGDRRLGIAIGGAVPLVLRGKTPVASWEPPGLKPAAPELCRWETITPPSRV